MRKAILCAVLAMAAMNCPAADFWTPVRAAVQTTEVKHEFMVSGVLRKSSTDLSIRLVHALVVASTEDEAIGRFSRNVLEKYPGYTLATTLVTVVESPKPRCDISV